MKSKGSRTSVVLLALLGVVC